MNLQIYFIFFEAKKISVLKTAFELHSNCPSNEIDLNKIQIQNFENLIFLLYFKTNPISNQTFFVLSKFDLICSRYAHSKFMVEIIELSLRDELYSDHNTLSLENYFEFTLNILEIFLNIYNYILKLYFKYFISKIHQFNSKSIYN